MKPWGSRRRTGGEGSGTTGVGGLPGAEGKLSDGGGGALGIASLLDPPVAEVLSDVAGMDFWVVLVRGGGGRVGAGLFNGESVCALREVGGVKF